MKPSRSVLAGWWRGAALVALVVALGGWEPFRTADPDVEAGNRAYADGRYDDALAAYDRAARRGGVDADGLAYDRGTAEARQAELSRDPAEKQRLTQRALDDLKQASQARDPRIRGGASYNRGNLLMDQDKLDDAIEAYKQALREQPGLDDARLNLELALRRRQKQQQSQPQQGQGQGRGQGQGQAQGQGQGQGGANPPPDGQGSGSQDGSGQGTGSQSGGGQGANPSQSGGNGQGANPPQNGGSGQGANPPQNGGSPPGSAPPRGRPQRGRGPQSPRTPADGKLDDLDTYSRRLQRDQARRQATGRAADPQHDW
ncbi:MAG TPA: tetratricopeptide repeat protein [Kofleriaceae bacterium]|nr:tetratricopeptide repeat protein [Kofleriaceae bacterium]